jgi:hypothetical protein
MADSGSGIPTSTRLDNEPVFAPDEIEEWINKAADAYATNTHKAVIAHRDALNSKIAAHGGGQEGVPPVFWNPAQHGGEMPPWSGAFPPRVFPGSVPYLAINNRLYSFPDDQGLDRPQAQQRCHALALARKRVLPVEELRR